MGKFMLVLLVAVNLGWCHCITLREAMTKEKLSCNSKELENSGFNDLNAHLEVLSSSGTELERVFYSLLKSILTCYLVLQSYWMKD
ncbi:hypothetical protein ACB092_06G022700 [Castanea dentata]